MTTATTAKATPGPLSKDGFSWGTLADGSILIDTKHAQIADKRLSVAPALLETLKEMQARYFIHYGNDDLYDKATATITSANNP